MADECAKELARAKKEIGGTLVAEVRLTFHHSHNIINCEKRLNNGMLPFISRWVLINLLLIASYCVKLQTNWWTSITMTLTSLGHLSVPNVVTVSYNELIVNASIHGLKVLLADNGRILGCGHEICFGWFRC